MRTLITIIIAALCSACAIEDAEAGSGTSSTSASESSTTEAPADGGLDIEADVGPQLTVPPWCSDEVGYSCQHPVECPNCPGEDCPCDECEEHSCLPNTPPNWVRTLSCPDALGNIRCRGCSGGGTMTAAGCDPIEVMGFEIPSVPDDCEIFTGPQPLKWRPHIIPCSVGCC